LFVIQSHFSPFVSDYPFNPGFHGYVSCIVTDSNPGYIVRWSSALLGYKRL